MRRMRRALAAVVTVLWMVAAGVGGVGGATGCGGGKAKFIDAGPIDAGHDSGEIIEIDAGVDAAVGHAGGGSVSGAVKANSPSYTLYGTLRSGDGSSSSPGYVRRGGVAGATQP